MSGNKIIEGLKHAVAGDFSAVTINGQRWVRSDRQPTLREIDEALIAFGVATTQTAVDPDRRWEAIKAVSEFLGRIRLACTQG